MVLVVIFKLRKENHMFHLRLLNPLCIFSIAILLILPIFIVGCGDEGDDEDMDVIIPIDTTLPPVQQPPDDTEPPGVISPPVEEPPIVEPPAEEPPIEEPGIAFQNDIFPIFQANCIFAGCHAAPPPSGLLLTTFDNFKKGGNSGPPFIPKDNKNSLIVKRITGVIQPQMPLGRLPLKDAEIQLIKDWIDEGAEDN